MPISHAVWDVFLGPLRRQAQEHLSPLLPDDAAGRTAAGRRPRLLEVGCGEGAWLAELEAMGFDVVGIDVDEAAVAVARGRVQGQVLAGRAEALPFPDASFDAVVMCSVSQYTDHVPTVAEMARVLVPGGRMALLENLAGHPGARLYRTQQWLRGGPPTNYLRWAELRALGGFFQEAQSVPAHLLTAAVLLPSLLRRRSRDQPLGFERGFFYDALHAVDRRLFHAVRPLAHLSWFALVRAVR